MECVGKNKEIVLNGEVILTDDGRFGCDDKVVSGEILKVIDCPGRDDDFKVIAFRSDNMKEDEILFLYKNRGYKDFIGDNNNDPEEALKEMIEDEGFDYKDFEPFIKNCKILDLFEYETYKRV